MSSPYPTSPRTRIKTFVTSNKDNTTKETTELIENKFAILEAEQILLREAEQVLRQNLHNSKEYPSDQNLLESPATETTTKFILPLEDSDEITKSSPSPVENNKSDAEPYSLNNTFTSKDYMKTFGERNEEDRKKFDQLKKREERYIGGHFQDQEANGRN
ncbi:hypothetical protein NQ317_018306 [Molorchus minor]|uniref:Uncharacterized protein n=1 Tax=Molorchus minor TaxID=1323400 RepID=A0ABQ9IWB0_9CUCU|nr:hypothetical protein NQ317_018306 [Molorchus minor]